MGPCLSREFVTGPCTRSSRNVPHYYFKVTDASILSHILVKLLKGSRLTIKSIQSDMQQHRVSLSAQPASTNASPAVTLPGRYLTSTRRSKHLGTSAWPRTSPRDALGTLELTSTTGTWSPPWTTLMSPQQPAAPCMHMQIRLACVVRSGARRLRLLDELANHIYSYIYIFTYHIYREHICCAGGLGHGRHGHGPGVMLFV